MLYRIECWSHQTGWYVMPQFRSMDRDTAEMWRDEMIARGRYPLRTAAEIRIVENKV